MTKIDKIKKEWNQKKLALNEIMLSHELDRAIEEYHVLLKHFGYPQDLMEEYAVIVALAEEVNHPIIFKETQFHKVVSFREAKELEKQVREDHPQEDEIHIVELTVKELEDHAKDYDETIIESLLEKWIMGDIGIDYKKTERGTYLYATIDW